MIQKSVNEILTQFELWRKFQGLTQREAAETLGVARTHLNKVVNKRTSPSIQLLERMENLMNQ